MQSADAASATTTYSYDEASRLTAINPPGGAGSAITFGLDALDRHTTRSVGGTTADAYAYLASSEVATGAGSGGSATTALLDADGTRLAVKTGSAVSWLVFDLHGSVAGLCPAGTTSLADAYRYSGWGEQVASAGSAPNPWRYRGLLNIGTAWDTPGALLDMTSRDYSPQLGVFTSADSYPGGAADPASMNRDPDGHMALVADGGYIAPTYVPHSAASVSGGSTTYVSTPKTYVSAPPPKRPAGHAYGPDCGFERLGCRDDPIAWGAGLGMGLGQSGWDLVTGIWDLGASVIDDTACTLDARCAYARLLDQQARAAAFWADPLGNIGQGVDDVATGISQGVHDLDESIFHARSGFEAWRSFGHATGTVALTVVPGVAALRGARMAAATTKIERIYEVTTRSGLQYVGQSRCIPCRLAQHVASGKISPSSAIGAMRWEVRGGRTAREIAEQLRIDDLGGISGLENKVNPIGIGSKDLLQTFRSLDEYLGWLDFHLRLH